MKVSSSVNAIERQLIALEFGLRHSYQNMLVKLAVSELCIIRFFILSCHTLNTIEGLHLSAWSRLDRAKSACILLCYTSKPDNVLDFGMEKTVISQDCESVAANPPDWTLPRQNVKSNTHSILTFKFS